MKHPYYGQVKKNITHRKINYFVCSMPELVRRASVKQHLIAKILIG